MSLFDETPQPAPVVQSQEELTRLTRRELFLGAWDAARFLRSAINNPFAEAVQVRAAMAVLDRSGFGPTSTIKWDDPGKDFSAASVEELRERVKQIYAAIQQREYDDMPDQTDPGRVM